MRSTTHPSVVRSRRTRLAACSAAATLGLVAFSAGRFAAAGLAPQTVATAAGLARIAPTVDAATVTDASVTALDGDTSANRAAPSASPKSPIDVEHVLDQLASRPGPAYRRYLIELLTRQALAEPGLELELLDRARAETDPELVAALGESLMGYYRATQDDRIPAAVHAALETEADPVRQRALLRFLGSIPGVALALPDFPARCASLALESPDPQTRTAAAVALATQAARGASSDTTSAELAATLVDVAARTADASTAERLLGAVDLGRTDAASVRRVSDLLDAPSPAIRRGAAQALASVAPPAKARATDALAQRVRFETDAAVRESLVDSIVRLDLADARPVLARLRGLDPALDRHIDRYDNVLALGLSEWRLVQRELTRS